MARKSNSFVVIGLGTFGATVAVELAKFDNYVIGIDISDARVTAHAQELNQALILDAHDEAAMREAGLEAVDVGVVAIGENIEASVLAAINLKTIGVKAIWAKATTKSHHRILMKLGVDKIIHPEQEVGQHIAQMLNNPRLRDYVSLGNGYHLVNYRVPKALEGKLLSDLPLSDKYNLRCAGVMRGSKFLGYDSVDCVLGAEDLMLLLGEKQGLRAFGGSL